MRCMSQTQSECLFSSHSGMQWPSMCWQVAAQMGKLWHGRPQRSPGTLAEEEEVALQLPPSRRQRQADVDV